MAYDQKLAQRVRAALATTSDISEKAMFGGLAFLQHGKMVCGVSGDDLMVRVGASGYAEALGQPHVRPMDFTGRPLKGFVYVAAAGVRTSAAVTSWACRALAFVATLAEDQRMSKPVTSKASARRVAAAPSSHTVAAPAPRTTTLKPKAATRAKPKAATRAKPKVAARAKATPAAKATSTPSARTEPTPVDAYVAKVAEPVRARLQAMVDVIRKHAPLATERLSYGLATWHQGENLIHLGAFAKHIGIYPGPAAIVAHAADLAPYVTSKGAIQIPHTAKLPSALLRTLTRWRVQAAQAKLAVKRR